ncbi:MAG: hypothetical protein WCO00_13740 [Rhodospirillaceae bacterium]
MSTRAFARAADYLYRGRLAAADGWCRRGLAAAPDDAAGLNLLGCIAAFAGLSEPAARCFERALPLPAARDNLERLAGLLWPPVRREAGFVLIKSWGYGFCSELAHVLGGLLLAEITGRVPVIHWGGRCLFSEAGTEGFARFFEPVSAVGLAELAALKDASLFPVGWSPATLGHDRPVTRPGAGPAPPTLLARPETILVCDNFIGVADLAPWIPPGHRWHGLAPAACLAALAEAYLRPRPELQAAAARFRARHLTCGPVVAVHVRGSDKVLEVPEVGQANRRCFTLIDALPAALRILLLTDDETLAELFRQRYGARLVMTECRRTGDATGIHYQSGADGLTLGREVMVDLLLALEADHFIGNGRSNVSALIESLRSAAGRDSTLVLDNQLYQHSCFL